MAFVHIKSDRTYSIILHFFYLLFLISLVFSFRAISSISIALLIAAGLAKNFPNYKKLLGNKTNRLLLAGFLLYVFLEFLALFYTQDISKGLANLRISSGLLLVPLAVKLASPAEQKAKTLLKQFSFVLIIGALYCLCRSIIKWMRTGDARGFFYHELVNPINQHAVYFSMLILISIFFLLEGTAKKDLLFNRGFTLAALAYLVFFLFLLSSKFAVVAFIIYLIYYLFRQIQRRNLKRRLVWALAGFVIILTGVTLSFNNPIRQRFSDVLDGNLMLVTRNSFHPGIYFNGVQFRLLQWRLVAEILTEEKKWISGTSPGDAQASLNAMYISKNMYAGEPHRGDRGYLAYNTHNQFLQAILQNGIPGLLALLMICAAMLRSINRAVKPATSVAILALLGWLFTESVLETQYGIMIFCFFPAFISASEQ